MDARRGGGAARAAGAHPPRRPGLISRISLPSRHTGMIRQVNSDIEDLLRRDGDGDALDERLLSRLADRAGRRGLLDVAVAPTDTPIGSLLLAATGEGLVRVAFETEDFDEVMEQLAERVSP